MPSPLIKDRCFRPLSWAYAGISPTETTEEPYFAFAQLSTVQSPSHIALCDFASLQVRPRLRRRLHSRTATCPHKCLQSQTAEPHVNSVIDFTDSSQTDTER